MAVAVRQHLKLDVPGLHHQLFQIHLVVAEVGLCLRITHRLYTAVPLQMVDAEDRLRESQGYRHRHELIATAIARLMQEVQRCLNGQCATRGPYLLADIERTVQA